MFMRNLSTSYHNHQYNLRNILLAFMLQRILQGFNIARMYYEVGEMEKALKSVTYASSMCYCITPSDM